MVDSVTQRLKRQMLDSVYDARHGQNSRRRTSRNTASESDKTESEKKVDAVKRQKAGLELNNIYIMYLLQVALDHSVC